MAKNTSKQTKAPTTTKNPKHPPVVVPPAPKDMEQPTMKVVRSNPTDPQGRLNDVLELMESHKLSPILETARDIVRASKEAGKAPPDWCVTVIVGTFDIVTAKDWNALRDNVV